MICIEFLCYTINNRIYRPIYKHLYDLNGLCPIVTTLERHPIDVGAKS